MALKSKLNGQLATSRVQTIKSPKKNKNSDKFGLSVFVRIRLITVKHKQLKMTVRRKQATQRT